MKKSLMVISAILLAACSAKVTSTSKTESKPTVIVAPANNEFAHGKQLYEANCASCHRLIAPGALTEGGWKWMMLSMAPKAKIEKSTEDEIMKYLLANCAKG